MTILFLLILSTTLNCNSYTIGFRGQNGSFDYKSFQEYALKNTECTKVFDFDQVNQAADFINRLDVPYELYGFSAGATAIKPLLKRVKSMPRYIITIGSWHSIDVDFTEYEINFDNFFDGSGKGNKSPGIHVENIPHGKMQEYVTNFFR